MDRVNSITDGRHFAIPHWKSVNWVVSGYWFDTLGRLAAKQIRPRQFEPGRFYFKRESTPFFRFIGGVYSPFIHGMDQLDRFSGRRSKQLVGNNRCGFWGYQ